ncbi:hypothetical protein AB6T85_07595 [Erwinia sp. ACCC 02193]|uniref:DUF5405 domain-containing protein n=1 Tax=Erwinia aeris TaxID=3239803 RepID=A0ABV4E5U6_9GAMM|nr:hypothetical protein [Erwinia sp. PsM31]MDN4629130.1 hypothetical protein [Erwinia sp. PsM31]
MLSINNGTHDIGIAKTGDYVLGRMVWRTVEGKRVRVSEVMAVYKSEALLARDLISDCIGIAAHRNEVSELGQMSDIYSRLLIACQEIYSVLSPLREQKKAEYEKRMRQGEE